ncbi:hypothetical protein M5K25_000518 [Dendrobium thyrsiflorum]|uniref:CCHC-type domain-containing protein n=1 Tax=Dendrobium thyrsiflorum TaxID=117978 RepID=A0ABD0VTU1_DENTH
MLCSFHSNEVKDAVMSGGPWFVAGHIIGMEEWTPKFSILTMKNLFSRVWTRLPQLLLFCWDEVNITRIASMVGTPLHLDGNMFNWGRREFARVSPVDSSKKFNMKKISSLCFKCGKIGHNLQGCSKVENHKIVDASDKEKSVVDSTMDNVRNSNQVVASVSDKHESVAVKGDDLKMDEYGPWIHVNYGRKKSFAFKRIKFSVDKPNVQKVAYNVRNNFKVDNNAKVLNVVNQKEEVHVLKSADDDVSISENPSYKESLNGSASGYCVPDADPLSIEDGEYVLDTEYDDVGNDHFAEIDKVDVATVDVAPIDCSVLKEM